jgi:hypothetical protein
MLDILARRPLEKIKEINDTKSMWRISIRLKDLWIVPHGKTQKHHFEMVVRDDLVILYSVWTNIYYYIVIGIFRLKGFFYVINRLYNIQFSLYIQIY